MRNDKLVLDNLNLVHYMIKKIIHINCTDQNYYDYYQEGCLALCIAADRYDESRGIKFSTYGGNYIKFYLIEYRNYINNLVEHNRSYYSSIIKVSRYLANNNKTFDDITEEDLKTLELSYVEYEEIINSKVLNFDNYIDNDDNSDLTMKGFIADKKALSEFGSIDLLNDIDEALDHIKYSEIPRIDNTRRNLFAEYIYDLIYEDNHIQSYYANKYNMSQPNVQRIIQQGMSQLREILKDYK